MNCQLSNFRLLQSNPLLFIVTTAPCHHTYAMMNKEIKNTSLSLLRQSLVSFHQKKTERISLVLHHYVKPHHLLIMTAWKVQSLDIILPLVYHPLSLLKDVPSHGFYKSRWPDFMALGIHNPWLLITDPKSFRVLVLEHLRCQRSLISLTLRQKQTPPIRIAD